jgi:hypothetical protein
MRLMSQAKHGFYPAPPEAIAAILKHLKRPVIPDPKFKVDDVTILDPCAGEAKALAQLAEGLSISPGHIYAVELNVRRAAIIAENHPDIRLLCLCSFEATRITKHSSSPVYLNPPFDDEFGGGREAAAFFRRATDLLVPGGIVVLLCPVHKVFSQWEMCDLLDTSELPYTVDDFVQHIDKKLQPPADVRRDDCYVNVRDPQ